ncbi:MAG: hypothetical protein CMD31_04550 [Flavobacteriales bacterium]|nr:hypothetical protein [Flavobacteriales bacterium]|tara:strand:+ start:264 stop:2555 length:2292 start_codon:yes stop_codon:yes gene_type:complete
MSVPSDKLKLMIQSYSTPKKEHQPIFSAPNNVSKNKQSVQFKDNRPDATTQLKVQQIANQPIQRQENKTGMPDNLKSGIENLSGMDMSDVKVHYNSALPAQLQAHAFAQGNQIHIASGQERHLPHEAWHVVQQKQGRVAPTKQLKGKVNINDDTGLEKEADVMGSKALQESISSFQSPVQRIKEKNVSFTTSIVQRVLVPGDPAPGMGAVLGKRFQGIINSSEANPSYHDLLQAVTASLNAFTNGIPNPLVTVNDCAKYGIRQAIAAGTLNNVQALTNFVNTAQLFSSGQVLHLGLNQGNVDTLIENEVKQALHDALKSVTNQNINVSMGMSDIITVIRNNIQGLTIPPQTAQQLFSIALSRELQATPVTTFHTYLRFKDRVLNNRLPAVIEIYFPQLPGTVKQNMSTVRQASRLAPQRFTYWEASYLKSTHTGLADAQMALSHVNTPNTMNFDDLSESYQSVTGETGNEHLARNPQNAAFNELTNHNKILLSQLLQLMPVVQAMLDARQGHGLDAPNVNPQWQNPAILVSQDNLVSAEEAQAIQNPGHKMQVRIRTAMRKMNNLVDRQVLRHNGTPNMILHKDLNVLQVLMQKKLDNIMGFRAFANDSGNQVNVGLDEKIEVLMHEMGHLIENNLGTKEWLDIESLLHMRHNNAPGGNHLSHVYDTGIMAQGVALLLPGQARSEPAYKGNMPATGRYSAKYYDWGSTEVMSMTIEHFGSPQKALNLIQKDPLQAAIILRSLQPAQFQQYVVGAVPQVTNWLP